MIDQLDRNNPTYIRLRQRFLERQKIQREEMKTEFEELFEVDPDHPKAEVLFNLALDYGHSGGVAEIRNHYSDFVELIR